MKRLVIVVVAVFVAASLLWVALPPRATADAPTGSFSMGPPNTAENSSSETITVAGSGSFDEEGGTVVASGSFTRFTAAGAVIDKGTWEATDFIDFNNTGFGGPNPGFQGGVLSIEVTLFPRGGPPETDVTMTITCCISPPGACTEGITVVGTDEGDFTIVISGLNLIHLTP